MGSQGFRGSGSAWIKELIIKRHHLDPTISLLLIKPPILPTSGYSLAFPVSHPPFGKFKALPKTKQGSASGVQNQTTAFDSLAVTPFHEGRTFLASTLDRMASHSWGQCSRESTRNDRGHSDPDHCSHLGRTPRLRVGRREESQHLWGLSRWAHPSLAHRNRCSGSDQTHHGDCRGSAHLSDLCQPGQQ